MADSINSKAKEYYDNDDTGGSLNSNLKDFLVQQGATGKSINTLWRDYAYGEGGTSLNTRLRNLWGTSGSLMKRWKETLGLTWDELKAFFNFRDIEPGFLLNGSTSFDGTNDYIDCGDVGITSYPVTFSSWFKTSSSSNQSVLGIYNSLSSLNFISVGISSGSLQAIIIKGGSADTTTYGSGYADGDWHHVSVVFTSATERKIYANGSLLGTDTDSVDFPSLGGSPVLSIGRHGDSSPDTYFNGSIANVGIWNRELSASEVESIYWRGSHSELKGTELTNLVSWYDLQGDVLDKQGSNDGTNNGATLNSDSYSGESPFKPRIQDKAATSSTDPSNFGEVYSGRALSFDGTNDYVTLSKPDFMNGESAFTMSAWALHDDTGSDVIITTDAEFFMGYNTGKLTASYRETDSTRNRKIATDALNSGEWYHLCATWDKSGDGEIKLYVNGYYVAQSYNDGGASTASVIKNGTSARVGAWVTGSQEMDGKLSSIKVFNTALTESQVRELYTKPETVLPTGVSASNLKLDLPMQEGSGSYIYDGSGNQNHGTISGATWTTGQEYGYQASLVRSNTPMIFDGSNDTVNIPDSSQWNMPKTVSMWFNCSSITANGISNFEKDTLIGYDTIYWGIQLDSTNNKIQYYYFDGAQRYWSTDSSISLNTWHHLVVVSTSSGSTIYLDGSSIGTNSLTWLNNNVPSPQQLRFGSYGATTNVYRPFNGLINDVAIWDVAIDADAVTQLYNSGVPLLPTSDSGNYDNSDSLVGYWRNDGNTTWTDRSTNSNDGTVSGSPVTILIPEGSTEGRDNQGYYLSDTTTISNGIRLFGSEYIEVQDSEILSFGDGTDDRPFSIEAWIKMDDATDFKIINKGIFNSTGEWWLEIDSNDKLGLYLLDESVASTYELALYNTALTSYEGQWIHISATYDGRGGSSANAGVKLYLNGSSVTTTLSGGGTYVAMENLGADVHIGKYDSTYAKGLIDEVRIYSKELSADEVSKNYTNGLGKHS